MKIKTLFALILAITTPIAKAQILTGFSVLFFFGLATSSGDLNLEKNPEMESVKTDCIQFLATGKKSVNLFEALNYQRTLTGSNESDIEIVKRVIKTIENSQN